MAETIVEQLADFTVEADYSRLPAEVIDESKRLVLDSIGCALGAIDEPKGRIGIEYGRLIGGSDGDATIIGTGERVSIFGASFANGELINTLDSDSVLPPGHVTPYVMPGALAVGESLHVSGREFIAAMAVAHEMSYRLGKAMDYLRDIKDGKVSPPQVSGYSATVFGATAAIVRLRHLPVGKVADALGIAGNISPVNSHRAWLMHTPLSTIKYLLAGALTQAALTAAYMAELGHRGDLQTLDDREFGFPAFIGTKRWEPEGITSELGVDWRFPPYVSIKPYPHCRIMHSQFDALTELLEQNDIKPDEIDGITAWVEGFVEQPVWLNRKIEDVMDAQFSMAHGLALAAHRVPPGPRWQDPEMVFSPSVMGLMEKVSTEVHPDYVAQLTNNAASRPARVEVRARDTVFVGERDYPKGSPSPDPSSYMTTDELIEKFRRNAEDVISTDAIDSVIDSVVNLETVSDIGTVMNQLARTADTRAASDRPTADVGVA
jgi:2-methylcitrate dehydratase PrpD